MCYIYQLINAVNQITIFYEISLQRDFFWGGQPSLYVGVILPYFFFILVKSGLFCPPPPYNPGLLPGNQVC